MIEMTIGELHAAETRMHELSLTCEQISAAHGFAPTTWDNLPSYLMFVVTEIDEALDAASIEDFADEVADIAIRILLHLRSLRGTDWSLLRVSGKRSFGRSKEDQLARVHSNISMGARIWRDGKNSQTVVDVGICLERALAECVHVAEQFGFSLEEAIRSKCLYNAERPHRHGHVEAVG